MRRFRALPCLLSACLAISLLVPGAASAKPGDGRELKSYRAARSDFSRTVKALQLSAADGSYDARKVAQQREARIAKQGRGPLFGDDGTRRYPRKVLAEWTVNAVEVITSSAPRIPGHVTWGTVTWEVVDGTSQGCRSELYRASDDVRVAARQSSSSGACDAVYSTFDGDSIVAGTRYYPKHQERCTLKALKKGPDMPEFKSFRDYMSAAENFMCTSTPRGAINLVSKRAGSSIDWTSPEATSEFAPTMARSEPFRPTNIHDYFNKTLEKMLSGAT